MKTHLLKISSFVMFCCGPLSAQHILWEHSYGGKHAEFLLDAQPTADYGFILAGASLSGKSGGKTEDTNGDLDFWIWKMDETGSEDWQKTIGGSGADLLYSIKGTKDGGFILAGTSDSPQGTTKKDPGFGREDIWVIKLNAKGGEEWQKTIGGNSQDQVKTIAQTTDGGYIIGGTSSSLMSLKVRKGETDTYAKSENSRGGMDYWVIKLDEKGTVTWQRTIGGQYLDQLESLEQTSDGGYIVGGYSNSPASVDKTSDTYGQGDYWILKLDKEGKTEWQKTLGGEDDDHLYSIHQVKGGGYIAAGNSASEVTGNKEKGNKKGTDFWVIRMDEKGEVLWQETYNTGKVDVLTSLVENSDGTYLLGGYAQSEVIGQNKKDQKEINDYIALKISDKGEELWKKTVGSNGEDLLKKLVQTRDGGYLLAGTSSGAISRDKNSGRGSSDFWVVKLKDKDKKDDDNGQNKTQLEAIPNPATDFTNIIVGFEFNSGTATLYDLSGRQLQSFAVTQRTIPLQMSIYPTGIYIMELKTDKGADSVKVIKK